MCWTQDPLSIEGLNAGQCSPTPYTTDLGFAFPKCNLGNGVSSQDYSKVVGPVSNRYGDLLGVFTRPTRRPRDAQCATARLGRRKGSPYNKLTPRVLTSKFDSRALVQQPTLWTLTGYNGLVEKVWVKDRTRECANRLSWYLGCEIAQSMPKWIYASRSSNQTHFPKLADCYRASQRTRSNPIALCSYVLV